MAGRRRKPQQVKVLDAEFVEELAAEIAPKPPTPLTPDEIWLEAETRKALLQARIESIQQMSTPEERYDAVNLLFGHIQQQFGLIILERMRWMDSPHKEIREEGLEVVVALQDQSNNMVKVRTQLYAALGLDEAKGKFAGKDVPKLLIPSRTAAEFEREFGEAVKEFGPPKGVA